MDSFKLVAFDLEGVLFNWHEGINAISKATNVHPEIIHEYLIQRHRELELGKITPIEFWNDFISQHKLNNQAEDLNYYCIHRQPKIKKMWDLARYLKSKNVKIAICTNSWKGLLDNFRNIFPEFAIFDYYFESDVIGTVKPNADYFSFVEKETGFSGNQILLIDDSDENLNGAKEFGWKTINPLTIDRLE